MTATTAATRGRSVPPATLALVGVCAVLAANLVLIEVLFAAYGTGKNAVLTVAKFVGLHAGLFLMCQLVLIARLPFLDRRIGMDRLTVWHRWLGLGLFWTVLLHATLIIAGYAPLSGDSAWRAFTGLAGVPASLLGMIAATTMFIAVGVSLRAARRRLSYEAWHAVHVLLYLTVGAGVAHQALEGTTFSGSPAAAAYWWTLWAAVLVALLVGRVGLPLWRNSRHRFRVAAVVPESDDVVSVHITGRDLHKLPARAGQFMIWRFPDHNPWWRANPFSLSAAPDGRSLRLTARAVGDTSAGLRNLPVGSRVFAEGPYGAFTALHQTRPSVLLVAGGVGVTPIRAMLEEADGHAVVLYRVRGEADAVLLDELRGLARSRGAQLHLLAGRTGAGTPPFDPFAPDDLLALVPDVADRDVYVCGPPAMTEAVLRSMRALRVPRRQVHAERFGLA